MKRVALGKDVPKSHSRRVVTLACGAIALAAFFILVLIVAKRHVGDIRPALFPAPTQMQNIEAGRSALRLPSGFNIVVFAKDLAGPRDLELSPQGTLCVSVPSTGQVFALPDKNGDGRADEVKEILSGLNRPHGLAFHGGKLFVAEETRVGRYNWEEATLTARRDKILFKLPAGGNHVTRSLVFNKQGRMFVSLGSTCNVCYEKEEWLAAVITSNAEGENPRLFAKGLRNSVFLAIHPGTDEVWAGDMGRDFLGDDLPPEEINIIRDGKHYGWPICYGNKIHDTAFDKNKYVSEPCAATERPIFEYQAHSAPLGLAFINSPQFPKDWQGDLLVAYHGSWNRSRPVGYKIVRHRVSGNTVTDSEDFLSGFLQGGTAFGRPVDVIFDKQGRLYVSDDKAGMIYKIMKR